MLLSQSYTWQAQLIMEYSGLSWHSQFFIDLLLPYPSNKTKQNPHLTMTLMTPTPQSVNKTTRAYPRPVKVSQPLDFSVAAW